MPSFINHSGIVLPRIPGLFGNTGEPTMSEEQEIRAFAAAVRDSFAAHRPDVRYLERMYPDYANGPVVAVVLHGLATLSPELDNARSAIVEIARRAFAGRAFQVVTCADSDDRARWCLTGQPIPDAKP
jgi:hypothetical protein